MPHKLKLAIQTACSETDLPDRKMIRLWLQAALSCAAAVTVRFVDAEESAALNGQYRQKSSETNILTFPYATEPVCEADLVLCPAVIAREAEEQQKPLQAHYAHMLVHGALHALGYDHLTDTEAEEMEQLEREILHTLDFQDPYREADPA